MRYNELTESKFLTNKDEIIEYIDKMFLEKSLNKVDMDKLKIEPDGLIYDGSLSLRISASELQVQFKSVTGNFSCNNNNMTSLEGVPKSIGGYFNCSNTNIDNLLECTQVVGGYFSCSHTNITSLKFCPLSVGQSFHCYNTKINDMKEYRYALYSEIGGKFESNNEEVNEIINTYSGSANRKHWPHAINLLGKI